MKPKTLRELEPVTDHERRVALTRGDIRFEVPPVCTAFWDQDDWIVWYRGGPNFRAICAEEAAKVKP